VSTTRTKRLLHALIVLATIVTLTAVHQHRANALVRRTVTPLWPGGTVPVCFDSSLTSKPNFDKFVLVLRTNVENTWGRVANVRFTGWGTCPAPWPAGTVVMYWQYGAFNASVGYDPAAPTLFKLDFSSVIPTNNNSTPDRWAYLAVHEFGHLLGFEHEMDRADNPYLIDPTTGCKPDGGGPLSNEYDITPYDQSSIMTYNVGGGIPGCGIAWDGRPHDKVQGLAAPYDWFQNLSAWDVAGVQATYGVKSSGSLVGIGGRCVNIYGDIHDWGLPLISYDCFAVENERWTRSQNGSDLTLAANLFDFWPFVTEAIDVPDAYLYPGFTPLWDYPVNNSAAQQLTFGGQQWMAYGDMCVAADSSETNAQLRVVTCEKTDPLERWDFEPNGRIRLSGTSLCTNVPWASAFTGNYMKLYPCGFFSGPYENEIFRMTDRGEITYHGMCMNVWWGNMGEDSPIALYPCSDGAQPYANEVFYTRGPIQGEGGHCLDTATASDGVASNLQSIGLAPCNGNLSQTWDYHFARRDP